MLRSEGADGGCSWGAGLREEVGREAEGREEGGTGRDGEVGDKMGEVRYGGINTSLSYSPDALYRRKQHPPSPR